MQNILDNKYVIGVLTILIFLYAASIRPELPPYIKVLFKNPIFKVFILFLIVVRGNKDPLFALAIAIASMIFCGNASINFFILFFFKYKVTRMI